MIHCCLCFQLGKMRAAEHTVRFGQLPYSACSEHAGLLADLDFAAALKAVRGQRREQAV